MIWHSWGVGEALTGVGEALKGVGEAFTVAGLALRGQGHFRTFVSRTFQLSFFHKYSEQILEISFFSEREISPQTRALWPPPLRVVWAGVWAAHPHVLASVRSYLDQTTH